MTLLQTPRDRAGLLILVLGGAILLTLTPFVSGLLGVGVLYVILVKPYRWLGRILRPGIAASITLVAALIIVALPLAWLIVLVVGQAPDALRSVQDSAVFARVGELHIGDVQVGAELAKASGMLISWLSAQLFSFLGSALVWLPAVMVLLGQGRYGAAAVLAVIGGVIASNIDNVILLPLVYKRVSNIHPMITLVGAFAGLRYFGLVGLLLGPLAIAYLFELLRAFREEYGGT